MKKSTVIIRGLLVTCLLLSGWTASAQFDLDVEVTNACNGPNSGAIEVTILNDLVGGVFTYEWAGPNSYANTTTVGFIATPEPGTYTVEVTRNLDLAMRNATADVFQSAIPLGFNAPIITDAGCNDGNGAITITGADGTGPYQYAIIPYPGVPATPADFGGFSSNNGIFTGLDIGSYSVIVRDDLGCIEIQDQIAVNQVGSILAVQLKNVTNTLCNGAGDGIIELTSIGRIGDVTYSLIAGGGATEADFELQGYQTDSVFQNLGANVYDAAVKDESGCVNILTGIGVTEPDAIEITTEIRFTSCDDQSLPLVDDNGSIEILTIIGGAPPYTRQWDGPNGPLGTGFTETDLIGGEYSVTITDQNGCEAFFPFTIYEGFDLVAIPTNVTCFEDDDGSIQLNIIYDDVRAPETANQEVRWFEWDGIIATPLADVDDDDFTDNLAPGGYVVQVTDVLGCVKYDTVEVTAPDSKLIITDVEETPNACIGDTNGIIEITAEGGGSTSYEYSIDGTNFQEESIFFGLATGNYTASVRDENGCVFSQPAEITEPPVDFNILGVNTTNIVCFADDEIGVAELVLDLPNLNGIQDINWLNFAGDTLIDSQQPVLVEQVDTLAEGAYTIGVKDIYGCVKTVDFTITRPEEFSVVLVSQDVPCPEGGNITLDVTVEGGTPNYNYVWARGSNILQTTSNTASTSDQLILNITDPSNAGNYTVTITDANGCPVNDDEDATPGDGILEFNVAIPDDIVIVDNPVVNNACIGGNDGSITISVSGGTPFGVDGYTYTWFREGVEFSNNQNISNLDAATYRVEVTDANDCIPEVLEVIITDPTTTFRIDTVAINPVVCNGETTGSIDVDIVVDAGHPTLANQFTYTWFKDGDPAPFRNDAIDLVGNVGPGVYELVINDNYFGLGQGCEQSATFEVEEFNPIVLNANPIDNFCPPPSPDANSASIELRPVGGLAPSGYSYTWEYNGGSFTPLPFDSLITNLQGGQYRVTVTDDLGCSVQEIYNITEFIAFSVDDVIVNQISCHDENDASIEIQDSNFNGTPQYTWTKDGSFFSSNKNINSLEAGLYELTIVDVVTTPSRTTDCTVATITETITNPDEYFIVETITDVTCNAGNDGIISTTINQGGPDIATGNITFRWTDEGGSPIDPGVNKTFIDNLTAGIYNLEIEDDLSGCTTTEQFEVIEYQEIFPVPTVVQLKCPGTDNASIIVTPQGGNTSVAGPAGYTYSWTRNGMAIGGTTNTQTNLGEGTYVVMITDLSGCSVPSEHIIDAIPPYIIIESQEQISCSGETDGAINLEVTGGSGDLSFQWSLDGSIISGEDSIFNLAPGDYSVVVTDNVTAQDTTCQAYTNTFSIIDPGTYTVTPTITAVTCDAENDGIIALNITDLPAGASLADLDFTWVRDEDGFTYAVNAPTLATDVGPGTYTLTISHESFSTGITTQCDRVLNYEVPADSPITLTSSVQQNVCPHENVASISIVISNPSGFETIEWFRNDTEPYATGTTIIDGSEDGLTGLATGKYTAVVTDNSTCSESISEVIQPVEPFILVTEEFTPISCIGENDGALNVVVEGGTGDINYTWFHNGVQLENRPDLEDLEPGDYTLSVTDSKTLPTGCNAFEFLDGNLIRTYTISEPDPLVVEEVNITQVTCNGEEDGIIEVRVVDNNGIVQDPANFVMTWYSIAPDDTESELLNSNVLSRGGLGAGRYRIEVNDNSLGGGSGCLYSSTFELNDNLPLEFTIATQQLSCGTATDGEIYVQNIAGGSTPYTITWRDQAGTDLGFVDQDTITGLGDGTYIATVTDANLCRVTQSGIIIIYTPINIKDFIVSDKLCSDSSPSEAAISLVLEGGDGGDYIIEWTGPNGFFSDQEDISELEPGGYSVTINQASTCAGSEVTQTFTIDEPITVTATAIVTPETCFQAGDGSITNVDIIISNQPSPPISENSFSYTWRYNGQVIANSITPPNGGLSAGEYELEINDNTPGSCITTQTFTIEDNPAVTLTPIINQITCAGDNDASITVEPLGGAPDYSYQWYQESTLPADALSGETSETLSNRGPGTYFVVVTDQSGCAKSNLDNPYVIEDIQPIEVPVENVSITQIKCIGETNGEIAINITGGRGPFDITWQKDGEFFQRDEGVVAADTAESRITNLADGIYTVTVDENSTCPPFTASYTIEERTTTFTGGVARPQAITCNNASDGILSAVIVPDTGHPTDFDVEWYKDDDTVPFSTEIEIDQLGPGTYRSEVTDAFGCMKAASVTLINPDPIFARAAVTELICNGAETAIIQLDPIGGYGAFTTTWSEATRGMIDNPGFRLASLGAGEYTISLADTVGCVKDTTILILDPIAMNLIPVVQNVDCQGSPSGSIDLDVTEGTAPYTFQWRRDSTLISLDEDLSEIVAGNYTVRVEDSNGCVINSDTIRVTEPDVSFTIQAEIKRVTCNNGSDGSIQPVIVEEGGTSTYRYNWYKDSVLFALDTETIVGISSGLYTVEVEDANGCVKTRNFEIINPPILDANNVTEDLSCFRSGDGAISVQAVGGYGNYTYEWSTGGEVMPDTTSRITGLEVGIYQVVIADAEGCDITRRFQVNQPLPIIIDYTKDDNTCPGPFDAFITPTVTGGRPPYTFLWERNGEPFTDSLAIDSLPPAEYVLTVTDSTLCEVKTDPIIIEAPDQLGFNFLEFVDNLCPTTENGMISVQGIGGTSPYTFSFDSSAFNVTNDFFGLAKGEYPLSVMDDVGCVTDTIVEINHQYDLQPDFTYSFQELAIDYDISFEDQTVGPGLTKWFWDFGDERASPEQDPVTQFEAVGEYIVSLTVENEVQCVATFSDTLQVEQGFVFTIPSGFSPNNDGLNDFFRPVFENIIDIRTNIVDRNGEIVFTSDSREEFWDGRYNDNRMPQGPYYYEISYTSRAGKTRFRKGKVLLLR